MHNNLGSRDEGISPIGADFYSARAKGGFGAVGVGIIDVYPWDFSPREELYLENPHHVANYRELVKRCYAYGALPFAQIGIRRIWPLKDLRKFPKLSSLPIEHIPRMIDAMVSTAARAQEAGFGAVDVHGIGWGAVSIFLSQVFNDRDDEWGGDWRRRAEFPLRIVDGIHQTCGADYPVFFRMHCGEFVEGGYGIDVARSTSQLMAEHGVLMFDMTGGSHATSVPILTPNVPEAAYAFAAREIKKVVAPAAVAASARITDPFVAEEILRRGWADFIALGRQALADADWANKAAAGEASQIRQCIACNECMDVSTVYEQPIRCLVNPRAGRLSEVEPLPAATRRKRVMVVGGGCVGLQAALTCAERGHEVSLYEKEASLGGKWLVSFVPPGREALYTFLQWLVQSVKQAGVQLFTGTTVDAELVRAVAPDVILVATGSHAEKPDIPGVDLPHVCMAGDVLAGLANIGRRVVVVGGGGVGVEVAHFLIEREFPGDTIVAFFRAYEDKLGAGTLLSIIGERPDVTLVGRNLKVGKGLGATTRWVLVQELRDAGAKVMTEAAAVGITAEGVWVEQSGERVFVPADTVVLASGYRSDNSLYKNLQGLAPEVLAIGEAREVDHALRGVGEALETALRV